MQHDINSEASKTAALLSGKIDKYEYLTDEKMPLDQIRTKEQAKFTYSSIGKALEKQTKKIRN